MLDLIILISYLVYRVEDNQDKFPIYNAEILGPSVDTPQTPEKFATPLWRQNGVAFS